MTDLRIVDAPVLLQESITDGVKMPTGGLGNYAISLGDIVWYVVQKEQLASKNYVDTSSKAIKGSLDTHISDKTNPHQVTKAQVGLGNVDNTADIDKPVSNAVSSAIITATTDMATKTYVNSKDGDLTTLTTTDKTSLVKAINEVVSVKADKATTLVGYGISDAYTKSEIDTNYGGVKTLYDKNAAAAAAGAGANGWTTDLVVENGVTQKQINAEQKIANSNLREKLSEVVSVKDFGAKGDGVTDDTSSINNLILELYQQGGGSVFFPESKDGYKANGPIYIPSNINIDGNNQVLIGDKTKSLFKTANVVNGAFIELGDFDSAKVIKNSKIHDFIVKNSALVFDFKSFTLGCSVKNIAFDNCTQGFKLDCCFYSRWENLTATPTSGVADKPFYHLVASSNAMIFDRITATVAWCWLIEGGSTALLFNGCTFEGGDKGFKFKGDNRGLKFQGCYFEAITGTLFDFSKAGVCVIDWDANYINGVDIIFDDGGADNTSHLFGTWESSNSIVNVGQTLGTPYTFRGLMKVDGARNNIKFFTDTYKDPLNPVKDANWITGKHTNLQEFANASVDGKANIMAKADIYTGVIPVKYSGDFGTPYINLVPFTTKSTIPTSTNTSFTIDTKLVWQPLSLFAKVVLEFRRVIGGVYQVYYAYGDIYGSNIELKGGIDPSNPAQGAVTATLSDNNGYLRITFNNVQNPNGDLYITGTVRALS